MPRYDVGNVPVRAAPAGRAASDPATEIARAAADAIREIEKTYNEVIRKLRE